MLVAVSPPVAVEEAVVKVRAVVVALLAKKLVAVAEVRLAVVA
jgi:hypothetical protein